MSFFKKPLLPIDLITPRNDKPVGKDIDKNLKIIKEVLKDKNIGYEQMNVASVGPTVTTFAFRPAGNVRIQQVLDLRNDFSLALGIHPIRIEAPIPGTHFIGIEVPNSVRIIVGLREELTNSDYKRQKGNLTICLGRNNENKSFYTDLTDLPHLLIAGATNSGKSNFLHSFIITLLIKYSPEMLRLILVDAKRAEFPVYNDIPHLLTPVVLEIDKTMDALKWCLNEIDRRFEILAKDEKRNIIDYNETVKDKLTYIVFIIDELSDLMVAVGKDAEASIIRLAMMGRAVGIHLILATSRPSVDVITGLIKANISTRIAFATASKEDSRVILDSSGAERLLGRGDMLFNSIDYIKPRRLQAPYISDEDIKKVVNYFNK
jgi:S-DNA-T family DNA segregation ATPase FtsK/SpoIIIE